MNINTLNDENGAVSKHFPPLAHQLTKLIKTDRF